MLRWSMETSATAHGRKDRGYCRIAIGRIDVLINNAGVFIPKPFTEYTTEDFNILVSTTLAGFLYVSQLVVKQMLRQKSAALLTSQLPWLTNRSQRRGGRSNHAEGRTECVTRALAIEYAKEGIRVNTIAPGVINTPMHKPETHDFSKDCTGRRIGEVKEVVDAALFLTDATFTSGEYCTWMAVHTRANVIANGCRF